MEWDSSKAKGKMLEVAWAWLILPSATGDGWDLLDLEVTKPTPGESQVVSIIPFHLAELKSRCIPSCGDSSATLGYGFMT